MTKSFDPEYIRNLAAGFVVNDLMPAETQEFEELLDEHPELIAEVEDLQEVLRQVLDGFTEVEAPVHLLPKILEQAEKFTSETTQNIQVEEINQVQPLTLSPVFTKRSLLRWKIIAGSMTALFLVFLGVDNYRLRQNLGILTAQNQLLQEDFTQAKVVKTMLQNNRTQLFTFKGVNSTNMGSGSIIINPEKQKAVMVFQNLPAPPPNHVYLLWTVVDSKKLPCGQVKPYSWGEVAYELPFSNQMYEEFSDPQFSGLIVTLETDANVSRPTGTVVMESSEI
jgi:anti-sigma-K factor RskA